MSSEPKDTRTILPSLDFLLQNSKTSESYSFICSKENNNTSNCNYYLLTIDKIIKYKWIISKYFNLEILLKPVLNSIM